MLDTKLGKRLGKNFGVVILDVAKATGRCRRRREIENGTACWNEDKGIERNLTYTNDDEIEFTREKVKKKQLMDIKQQ